MIKKYLHNLTGFSFYKNAYILWDENKDERIIKAVDKLERQGYALYNVLFSENQGTLFIFTPPAIYYQAYKKLNGTTISIVNDSWIIQILNT